MNIVLNQYLISSITELQHIGHFEHDFNSLHAGLFFALLLSSGDFFQNELFQIILSGTLPEC